VQTNADQALGPNPVPPEIVGYLVGALVQLPVAELPLIEDDGNRVGIFLHLLLE
jgi:hypothetical protein